MPIDEPSPEDPLDPAADGDVGDEASGGDAHSGDPFFVSKQAAAVLKHGILSRYLVPFVAKVGSTSPGHRVALLDGYAGPGRYEDGTPGSPALLAETARRVSSYRTVECHFVEQRPESFQSLQKFLAHEGAGLHATPYRGRVEEHLTTIISRTRDVPLLAYLDPFGFGVPFQDVVRLLRRYPGKYQPATEVLLNFTANGIRRAGGLLTTGRRLSPSDEKTLQRGDAACGSWWREVVMRHEVLEHAVEEVARTYLAEVGRATGTFGFPVPVRKREHHKPVYYLLFFTRHRDGLWFFNDAVSKAAQEWRESLAPPPWEPDPDMLFDIQTKPSFAEQEAARERRWIQQLERNIESLLDRGPFVVGEKIVEVYGETLGEARDKHVKRAIKNLYAAGRTSSNGRGETQNIRLQRPT